jgi:type VI protein secretion system component Hcp
MTLIKIKMKKLYPILAILVCIFATGAKPINAGTETHDNKAAIDLTRTNKALLITRVAGTVNEVDPIAGLRILSKNKQTPNHNDESMWKPMEDLLLNSATPTDRITYTITSSVPGFTKLEFPCNNLTEEITIPVVSTGMYGKTSYSDFSFTKPWDKNSQAFSRMAAVPTIQTSIEFKLYAPGAVTPYISYNLRNIVLKSFQTGGTNVNDPYRENITLSFENYGFKYWANNVSFGFNLKTGTFSAY